MPAGANTHGVAAQDLCSELTVIRSEQGNGNQRVKLSFVGLSHCIQKSQLSHFLLK